VAAFAPLLSLIRPSLTADDFLESSIAGVCKTCLLFCICRQGYFWPIFRFCTFFDWHFGFCHFYVCQLLFVNRHFGIEMDPSSLLRQSLGKELILLLVCPRGAPQSAPKKFKQNCFCKFLAEAQFSSNQATIDWFNCKAKRTLPCESPFLFYKILTEFCFKFVLVFLFSDFCMSNWNDLSRERLIQEYKKYPCLWWECYLFLLFNPATPLFKFTTNCNPSPKPSP